jgi:hypothetical protein
MPPNPWIDAATFRHFRRDELHSASHVRKALAKRPSYSYKS